MVVQMKNKIEIGQCYRTVDDHIHMVVEGWGKKGWLVEDTLTKDFCVASTRFLITLERPFQNFG